MFRVQNFTPKSRHLANEKNCQNAKIWAVTLREQNRQNPPWLTAVCFPARPLGVLVQGFGAGPCLQGAVARQEPNKEREPACMCLSLSHRAVILRSSFHLPSQSNQGSSLAFCAFSELSRPPVPISCGASSCAPQSAVASRRRPGTDGLISADKGAAFKEEARRKPSGLISLSGTVNGMPRAQAGAGWRTAPLQGARRGKKFSVENALLVPLNGVCFPLFQTAPAKPSFPQYLRYTLAFAQTTVLRER